MKGQNGDCENALPIEDSIHIEKTVSGHGKVLEIAGNPLGNKHFFTREHNTAWYFLTAPASGTFTFELLPINTEDDWDFMLYRIKGENYCNRIKSKMMQPVRTNLSRNNLSIKGKTGLDDKASQQFVPAGPGPDFSKAITVEKGEKLMLITDNVDESGKGHKLILHWPRSKPASPVKIEEEKGDTVLVHVELLVRDQEEENPIDGAILRIEGVHKDKSYVVHGKSNYSFEVGVQRAVEVTANARGYLFRTWNFETGNKSDSITHIFELEKIKKGSRLKLERLYFEGNEATILPGSKGTLEALLSFMKENPELKIEIEGHVNGPNSRNTRGYKELSRERAEAVKKYLMEHGIEAGRMTTVGYGNKHMIYPSPKKEEQSAANRRVEILVK